MTPEEIRARIEACSFRKGWKETVTEIEATAEDLRANRTLGEALTMVVVRLAGRFGRYADPEEEDGENHEQNRPMEEG